MLRKIWQKLRGVSAAKSSAPSAFSVGTDEAMESLSIEAPYFDEDEHRFHHVQGRGDFLLSAWMLGREEFQHEFFASHPGLGECSSHQRLH